jgi:predicted nucleic acid-binding protein
VDEVFADTNYLIAVQIPRDSLHTVAVELAATLRPNTRIVTSELVLLEFLTHFSRSGASGRQQALATWEDLHRDPTVTIIPATLSLLESAAVLYGRAGDKPWSLTDCASFVIMRERKIPNALTFDHHFEQAGFRAMMRDEM